MRKNWCHSAVGSSWSPIINSFWIQACCTNVLSMSSASRMKRALVTMLLHLARNWSVSIACLAWDLKPEALTYQSNLHSQLFLSYLFSLPGGQTKDPPLSGDVTRQNPLWGKTDVIVLLAQVSVPSSIRFEFRRITQTSFQCLQPVAWSALLLPSCFPWLASEVSAMPGSLENWDLRLWLTKITCIHNFRLSCLLSLPGGRTKDPPVRGDVARQNPLRRDESWCDFF